MRCAGILHILRCRAGNFSARTMGAIPQQAAEYRAGNPVRNAAGGVGINPENIKNPVPGKA